MSDLLPRPKTFLNPPGDPPHWAPQRHYTSSNSESPRNCQDVKRSPNAVCICVLRGSRQESFGMWGESKQTSSITDRTAGMTRNNTSSSYLFGLFPRWAKIVRCRDTTRRCRENRAERVMMVTAHLANYNSFGKCACCWLTSEASD